MGAMCHGMSTSTLQLSASELTAWRQLPSQSSLKEFSLVMMESAMPSVDVTVKS